MKRKFLIPAISILLLSLFSCKKYPPVVIPDNRVPKGMLLKEWRATSSLIPERTYQFYYNKRNEVDSIYLRQKGIAVLYRVTYKSNGRIDNVTESEDGFGVGLVNNYRYNQQGLITHYDWNWNDHFGTTGVIPVDIGYGEGIVTVRYNTIVHTFTFNSAQDITHMKNNTDRPFDGGFIYDQGINPLFYVRNLYAIMIDLSPYYYEYMLAKHNFLTKSYGDGYTVNYTNTYDQKNRMIRRDFVNQRFLDTQSFYYTYY